MQATGVLLLFCTSAYWVLTEAFPTTTVKYDIAIIGQEIISILNSNYTFPTQESMITLPFKLERQECCKKNLKSFMSATQTFFQKNIDERDHVYHNLDLIQNNFSLYECKTQKCACGEALFPPGNFKRDLKAFLERIFFCLSKDNSS